MIHAVVAILFLALPIAAWVLKRSLAWVAAALIAGVSIAGVLVSVTNYAGYRWTWTSLELLLVATFVVVLVAAWATRPRGGERPSIRHQWWAIGLPMVVVGACVVISRLLAAPSSGLFTGVGFFMRRIYAEDNAKWLDFTSRLVQGEQIVQTDPLGGPLQLFLVPVADLLSTVSLIAFGGINEVFVMSNTVIYGQFGLAILAAAALAPVAERAFRSSTGGSHLPLPLIWTGAGIITIASLAASGLGHLTLQFTFLVLGLWVAAFLVRAPSTVTSLASLAMVPLFLVWFPIAPVSAVVMIVAVAFAVAMVVRRQRNTPWILLGLWGITIGLVASDLLRVLSFLTDNASVNAGQALGAAGAVAAGVGANSLNLNFLSSQGGTEEATAISGALAAAGALGAAIFLDRNDPSDSRWRNMWRFGPAIVIAAYAVGLLITGSWWAGDGPNYGADKTTFLATFVIAAATIPLALRLIDVKSARATMPQWVAIGGIGFLLSVDGIAPRAAIYVSPEQWPDVVGEDRGYWWPAEVKSQADQPISSMPIACTFWFDTTKAPTALPDGQPMYACTRLLAGMNGADYEALPLVTWARREWFTNEAAWDPEYPGLSSLAEDLKARNFILLDYNKNVIGLEPMNGFLQRFKPPWAQDQN